MDEVTLKNLENFMRKTAARVPIYQHREEVVFLRQRGYSYEQIIQYFQETYEIKTSIRTLKRVCNSAETQTVAFAAKPKPTAPANVNNGELSPKQKAYFAKNKKD